MVDTTTSPLFQPWTIAGGRIKLSHRIVMAPMTRNRGVPLTDGPANNIWLPDAQHTLYYSQRASPGGLLITEGLPPSLSASGMPHVPGLFHPAQLGPWKAVTDAVHAKGGRIYAQLWHAGRATVPQFSGDGPWSASATVWDTDDKFPFRTPVARDKVGYREHPPVEMREDKIRETIGDFVRAGRNAVEECGFDGVEINGGNGNLIDQFLHSNINTRTDAYGGSIPARSKFLLDLLAALTSALPPSSVALRLEPACLYQQTRGAQRVEQWSHLCEQIAATYSNTLSYVHFIEPRFDRIGSDAERDGFYASWSLPEVSNEVFRKIIKGAGIPVLSCGGWNADNAESAVGEEKGWDGVVFAKWFTSNPDLPERLRNGHPLAEYDRSRFYGSWDGIRENGYTTFPTYEEQLKKAEEEKKAGTTEEAKAS